MQPGTKVRLQHVPLVDFIVLEHCAASLKHVGHPSLRCKVYMVLSRRVPHRLTTKSRFRFICKEDQIS